MEIKASLKYLRTAPRKTRLLADLVRGMNAGRAKFTLRFSGKKAAEPILKLLNSALANAKNNSNLSDDDIKNLYIKKITVDEGPKLKRWKPVARGAAHTIHKKTSHINLVLDEKKEGSKKKKGLKNTKKERKVEKSKKNKIK